MTFLPRCTQRFVAMALTLIMLSATAPISFAQFPGSADAGTTPPEDEASKPAPKLPEPKEAKRLAKGEDVWIDAKKGEVIVDGYISLREGVLEMLACLAGTKEHESIVGVNAKAQTVHAALLAVGAKSGKPVQFRPEFKPPTGSEIGIEIRWLEDKGKWRTTRAQEWIVDSKTKKPMAQPWVFAGSGFWKDPENGKEFYMAESGDLICVSNFTTAMLDIPIESSQSNEGLMFEANTAKIPPLGTPVRMVLTPKLEKAAAK